MAGSVLSAGGAHGGDYRLKISDGIEGLRPFGADILLTTRAGREFQVTVAKGAITLVERPRAFEDPPRHGDMLPDGEIAGSAGRIVQAWLTGPTTRYAHGVLGDRIEASGLAVHLRGGPRLQYRLPDTSVFEDRKPRIADVDGDGLVDVVSVRSHQNAGAAVAVLAPVDGALRLVAESLPIGLPNRWLNPVGVADFDGDGTPEIAIVVTPHIGGILTILRQTGDRLIVVDSLRGFSNHAMGSTELGSSTVADMNGDGTPDLVVPDARLRNLRIVTFKGGRFAPVGEIVNDTAVRTAILSADINDDQKPDLVYGLKDQTLRVVLG